MKTCKECGSEHSEPLSGRCKQCIDEVRNRFRRTYFLALLTGIFWLLQLIFRDYTPSIFALEAGLLSLVARTCFIASYIRGSKNLLGVSVISSTSSLVIGEIGALLLGFFGGSLVYVITGLFSIAALISYFNRSEQRDK